MFRSPTGFSLQNARRRFGMANGKLDCIGECHSSFFQLLQRACRFIPIIAVGCFGGVRPEESVRMTWDMVDFKRKHIDLPAEITKAGDRRIVDMADNLLEWLLPCRKDARGLLPVNFHRKRWALCREMNWKEWPDDILRHSYGSYHLAKHRNAALTAEQMGHKNARMLYTHYRAVVKEASEIEDYWKLSHDS